MQMSGSTLSCGYANFGNRPYYPRRCKDRKSFSTNIESLPEELLFEILLLLSSKDIHNGARLVSKRWYNIIRNPNFVKAHLRNNPSTVGLLIQSYDVPGDPAFVSLRRGKVEGVYILNPETNFRFDLPRVICEPDEHLEYCIAYSAASKEYKVVHTSYYTKYYGIPKLRYCAILTVGVDKSWMHVGTQHLSATARNLLTGFPLATEGFIHWTSNERLHTHGYGESFGYYLPMGSCLTLFIERSEFSFEILKMKSETGEWTKLPNVDLEGRRSRIEQFVSECCGSRQDEPRYLILEPGGWLDEEVLVLHVSPTRVFVVYNVRTQEIDFFKFDYDSGGYGFNVLRKKL
ncbi:hypothetical protein MIMGU_mgv1a009325mg [Erythranthe guttata]|uniref:F-box domain-containing protein n=1 Tax=Erythranthe guttata TaxID=4155 RepID=A0A022Q3Q2_ERYGU|nr:hypothetical protein MIMGU_mgv1a009325mg [Erythranthe guttata]